MDLNKFVIDIHVEGVNNTRTKTLPTATLTNVPTLGTRTTSRATSLTKAIPSASSHQPSPTILLTNSTSPRPTSAPTSAAASTKCVRTINTGCRITPVPEKRASFTPTTSIPSDDPSNDKETINSKRSNFFFDSLERLLQGLLKWLLSRFVICSISQWMSGIWLFE